MYLPKLYEFLQFNSLDLFFVFLLETNIKKWYFKQKGGIFMNKIKKALLSTSKNLAISSLKRDANSTTCTAIYQPKAPASLDKFKKHID